MQSKARAIPRLAEASLLRSSHRTHSRHAGVVRADPSATVPRLHRGDIMSPETRSAVMARIRGRDTGPELLLARLLRRACKTFQTHQRDLPGRPDFVFRRGKVAVFVDGCFWHGWRFPAWRLKLSEKWEAKIDANRKRDRRNHARLRRQGWHVIRIWEHQLKADPDACLRRILNALR